MKKIHYNRLRQHNWIFFANYIFDQYCRKDVLSQDDTARYKHIVEHI